MTQKAPSLLLNVEGLSVWFATDNGRVRAIDDVSFQVHEGEILSIVGESGSGKSVTTMSLIGLHDPKTTFVEGAVSFQGKHLLEMTESKMRTIRGKDIALISQDPMTALTPVYTIGWQIAEQIRVHEKISKRAAYKRAIELLGEVGLPNPEQAVHRYPHELSGGMRQRAVIAMALSCNPKLLIADEPTTALDVTVQAQVLDLLLKLRKDFGSAIILITHDMGVVAEVADRVHVMYAGRIVERGTTDELFSNPMHPYTWGLLNSIPPLTGERVEKLPAISGMPPTPANMPRGCGFQPRCRYAGIECSVRPPILKQGDQSCLCVLTSQEIEEQRKAYTSQKEPAL